MIEQSLKIFQEENQLNEDLISHQELQNEKSVISEQQITSQQYITSEKDINIDQQALRYNLMRIYQLQNQRRITQNPLGKGQKKLSYLKVIPFVQETKQSQRRIVQSNDEILIPKQYSMIEEIETTLQKGLKPSLNIDSISLKSQYSIKQQFYYITCHNIKLKLNQNYGLKLKKREVINFGIFMNIYKNILFQVLQKMQQLR